MTYPAQEPSNKNWAAEATLDVEMVSATCPNCHIVLVETNSDSTADLLAGVDRAVALGVNAVSMSWGTSEYSTETSNDSHFSAPNVAFVASSGDYGYGTTSWPAASPHVFSVGGTDLQADSNGNWSESAWAGSTSGCSLYEPKPSYQHDGGCANRTMNDISADGGTAVSLYLTYPVNGWSVGWQGAGGTSAAAPMVAGILVLAPQDTTATAGPGTWYSSAYTPGAFSVNDITSGSTGSCGTYLCTAGTGYDGPTGLGSPDGIPPSQNSRVASELYGPWNAGEAGKPPCHAGEPVICATGDLYESAVDLSVPGRGMALNFARTYNSLDAASAAGPDALGWGWTDTYAMTLTTDATTGAITVHQGNGSTVTFSPQGGAYVAPGWVTAALTKNPDGTFTYQLANLQSYTFSSAGQLVSETDRNGYVTTLTYTGAHLTSVTDPSGRSLRFGYNAAGQLVSATDPASRTVTYGYDAAGNLASVTDPAGDVTGYSYDGAHRLTGLTDPRGNTTATVYDASNRVVSQTDPLQRVTTLAYTGTAVTTTTITDPNGNVTAETYNPYLQLIALTQGKGTGQAATWTYAYNAYTGQQASVTDPNQHTQYATWDAHGNQTSIMDALNRYTSATYDAFNDLTSRVDAQGITTTLTYDAHHNLASVSTPLNATGQTVTTTYGYDPNHPGDLVSATDPDGNVTQLAYDSSGDLTAVTDPDGHTATATYNAIGWRTSTVSPRGNAPGATPAAFTTLFSYDGDGRPITTTDPLGNVSAVSYDADGNATAVTDANKRTTAYTYDLDNELTQVTKPDGSTTSTGFDKDGNVTTQTDGNGHITTYGYDPLNRQTVTTDALGRRTTRAYDAAGLLTGVTDAKGGTASYAYDAANERTGVTYGDGHTPNVTWHYDADGRRIQMSDGSGTTRYSYDSIGRLSGQTDGAGATVSYAYDLAGRLTSLTYPTGQAVTRTYDPAGLLSSVTDWTGGTTRFTYNADSVLSGQQRPNGTASTLGYDTNDQLTQLTDSGPAGTILNLPYTYDPDGLVATANPSGASTPVTQSYAYDARNRLTAATYPAGASGVTPTAYAYDAANNITAITTGSLSTGLAYDDANQLVSATSTAGASTYSYDADGNRIGLKDAANNTTAYGYDAANRLTSFSGPPLSAANTTGAASQTAAYSYNGDGLRMAKTVTVSGVGTITRFAWDLGDRLPLLLSDGLTAYVYGPGNRPIEQINLVTGTPTYLHTDRLGSVRALTNGSGAVIGTAAYSPYGRPLSTSGATSPLGFAGEYTDSESGLVYLRARYYDPSTGQFVSRDPLVSMTGDAYAYGDDSPLNGTDPSGLCDGELGGHRFHMPFTADNGMLCSVIVGVYAHALGTAFDTVSTGTGLAASMVVWVPVVGPDIAAPLAGVSLSTGAAGGLFDIVAAATGQGQATTVLLDIAAVGTGMYGNGVAEAIREMGFDGATLSAARVGDSIFGIKSAAFGLPGILSLWINAQGQSAGQRCQ